MITGGGSVNIQIHVGLDLLIENDFSVCYKLDNAKSICCACVTGHRTHDLQVGLLAQTLTSRGAFLPEAQL